MTRYRFCLALLITSLVVMGMSLQADPGIREATVEGTVIRAGDAKLTLVASASNDIVRFEVASDAIISRDGKNVKLEEVAFGDFALVSAKDAEDVRIATVIAAVSPFKLQGDAAHRTAAAHAIAVR